MFHKMTIVTRNIRRLDKGVIKIPEDFDAPLLCEKSTDLQSF